MLKILSIDRGRGTLIAVCDKCDYVTDTIADREPRKIRFKPCSRCGDHDTSEDSETRTEAIRRRAWEAVTDMVFLRSRRFVRDSIGEAKEIGENDAFDVAEHNLEMATFELDQEMGGRSTEYHDSDYSCDMRIDVAAYKLAVEFLRPIPDTSCKHEVGVHVGEGAYVCDECNLVISYDEMRAIAIRIGKGAMNQAGFING